MPSSLCPSGSARRVGTEAVVLIPLVVHNVLDHAFEQTLGRTMTPLERDAKRHERETIERRERWYQMALDHETDRSRMLRGVG